MLRFPGREPEDDFVDDGFYLHHGIPLPFGGLPDDGDLRPLPALTIDRGRLARPWHLGPPPLYHIPLPPPSYYRLPPPMAPDIDMDAIAAGIVIDSPLPAGSPLVPDVVELDQDHPEDDEPERGRIGLGPTVSLANRVDPLYPFLLYLALGIGTLFYDLVPLTRYTILWTALIALGAFFTLVDAAEDAPPRLMTPGSLGWGFSIGLVFALPLVIIIQSGLSDLVRVIFPNVTPAVLFQSLAIIGPLGESLFFRGGLQERRGFVAAVLGSTLSGIVFFLPAVIAQPVYLVAIGIFMLVLSGVYSFIRSQYGLGAATLGQVVINLLLLFVPAVFIA